MGFLTHFLKSVHNPTQLFLTPFRVSTTKILLEEEEVGVLSVPHLSAGFYAALLQGSRCWGFWVSPRDRSVTGIT